MCAETFTTRERMTQTHSGIRGNLAVVHTVLVVVLAAGMLVHLLTLTIHPRVFIDEAWISNASWTWLTTTSWGYRYSGLVLQIQITARVITCLIIFSSMGIKRLKRFA